MDTQKSFAQAEYAQKKKTTRREKFLNEMEQVVPWARLVACIQPHYFKGERGRKPVGIERMLRMYFLQQWYALADEALEDALYDSHAMRSFAGIDLGVESVPDATTLLKEIPTRFAEWFFGSIALGIVVGITGTIFTWLISSLVSGKNNLPA